MQLPLYFWEYDGRGQLIDTNCPELAMNTVFANTGCMDYMLEYGQEHSLPVILTAINHAMYDDFIECVHKLRVNPDLSPAIQSCINYIELHAAAQLLLEHLASGLATRNTTCPAGSGRRRARASTTASNTPGWSGPSRHIMGCKGMALTDCFGIDADKAAAGRKGGPALESSPLFAGAFSKFKQESRKIVRDNMDELPLAEQWGLWYANSRNARCDEHVRPVLIPRVFFMSRS